MSRRATDDQALILAGVTQFVLDAHTVGAHGEQRPERLDAALGAIFCDQPDQPADVVSGGARIPDGIHFLHRQLTQRRARSEDAEVARNVGQVLRLARRLLARPDTLTAIRAAVDHARLAEAGQAPSILAEAYQQHLSPIPPRVLVPGDPSYLNNPVFAERIRTHLLAAVRCAVLWRHIGGRFWRLALLRRRFSDSLTRLATTTKQS